MNQTKAPAETLRAGIAAYLDWHALRGSSPRHREDVARMLALFECSAGDTQALAEIGRTECERFLRGFQERGCKPNTVKAYHRVLDAFFRWQVTEERLACSPMARVPKPKVPLDPIKPLTADEVALLIDAPDRKTFTGVRDTAFVALLVDTGLRVSEALSVQLADLDLKQRSIAVMGKGGKARPVFYGETSAAHLKVYSRRRQDAGDTGPLFINSLGEPLCRFTMTERLREYGKAAGIVGKRVSPHTLRHTFAISWLMGGGDALSLQRLLGHSSPTMTARYVNFATADLAKLHRSVSPLDRLGARSGSSAPTAGGPARRRIQ